MAPIRRRSSLPAPKSFRRRLFSIPFKILTFAYYIRIRNTTIEPLRQIEASRSAPEITQARIAKFVTVKRLELHHVRVASTISAAATIGVFSWPDATSTFWPARALWYISMILSFFSLIASQLDRLLDAVPAMDGPDVTRADIEYAFHLVTWCPYDKAAAKQSIRLELKQMVMIYFWQSPVMQMSWSWIAFLMGLTLYIIKVFIHHSNDGSDRKVAITFLSVIGFALVNFFGTGIILHWVLSNAEQAQEIEEDELDGESSETKIVRTQSELDRSARYKRNVAARVHGKELR